MAKDDKKQPEKNEAETQRGNPIFDAFKAAVKAIRKEVEDIIKQSHHDNKPK